LSESSTGVNMVEASGAPDVEKDLNNDHLSAPVNQPSAEPSRHLAHQISSAPFIGRVGGNQAFVLDRDDASNASILQDTPDAAPGMTLAEQLDLRPFRTLGLWKAAVVEGMGESNPLTIFLLRSQIERSGIWD
jgi:hypothetical protein